MKKHIVLLFVLALSASISATAATNHVAIGPSLQAKLNTLAPTDSAGVVIITFDTATGLAGITDLDTPITGLLARNGIATVGHRFETLGMISAVLTKAQVTSLSGEANVRSLWANDHLYYNMHQARVLCGVDKLRADAALKAQNGNHPIDGSLASGQFSVAVIDSGIDTNNADLPFDVATSLLGQVPTTGKVIQNVQVVGDDAVGTVTYAENVANTDSVGHGTHCSGIIGGTGGFSRTTPATTYPNAGQTEDFSGVAGGFTGTSAADLVGPSSLTTASGVKIVGLGSGAGAFVLDALGGFEYSVANQIKYNIRVTSNSYGSIGVYDPDDPISVAIKSAYDRNMVTVFASGNSGPGVDTISSNSKSPYCICVAAGTKEGGLASFSSRGLAADERVGDAVDSHGVHYNPNAFNLNAITAPGTGREFEFDAPYDPTTEGTSPFVTGVSTPNPNTNGKGFFSDIISTRSKAGTYASGTNDQEFSTPYLENYTMISGTSMACPFVAGTCALLISVKPTLTPDQIKNILQTTATHLPDYEDYESGAGYMNVYAAVDYALNPSKPYGPMYRTAFNEIVDSSKLAPPARPAGYPPASATGTATTGEDYTLPYTAQSIPATDYATALSKAAQFPGQNAYAFNVVPDPVTGKVPAIIDIRIQFGNDSAAGFVGGNALGLYLWAPNGAFYSSGLALPILNPPSRQVVVKFPMQGTWVAELRPVRGLAAVPVTPPTGAGLPDTTTGQIYRTALDPHEPSDIATSPQRNDILFALANRSLDIMPDGTFQPTRNASRGDFAQALADNTPLRQTLASVTPKFTDPGGTLSRIAEALSVSGSTLRDWDFTPAPTLPSGQFFFPRDPMNRLTAAIALVRALGLDKEALALSAKPVQVLYHGALVNVPDANDGSIPDSAKGYVQLAINRGILTCSTSQAGGRMPIYFRPTKPLSRADLAVAVNLYRQTLRNGNTLAASEYP